MIHTSPAATVPYAQPLLPTANKLLPYLRTIDTNRYYSNRGPLVLKLEERLTAHFQVPTITASSATSALTASLLALNLPPASVIATPAWTFAATPAAIIAAGHIPHFVDVDPTTHTIHSEKFLSWPAPPAAVVPVMPFGSPAGFLIEDWDVFTMKTGIPVVVDAAAGFGACSAYGYAKPRKTPFIISTHCTKPFSTGEGGLILSTDANLLEEIRRRLNFGLNPERAPTSPGINGKMSEYHAAVGLAELDEWRRKSESWVTAKMRYHAAFGYSFTGSDAYAQSTFNVPVRTSRYRLQQELAARGIETRISLYGVTHTSEPYKDFPREDLPVTTELVRTQLSLPFSVSMNEETIKHVARTFKELVACPDV